MEDEAKVLAEIQGHRDKIDEIDEKIVGLLNERTKEALAIRALKPGARMGLYDAKREEEIFARIDGYNPGPLYNDYLREIYQCILKVMKEIPSL